MFAEMEYDTKPELDPLKGKDQKHWRKGQLPEWKDEVFDPYESAELKGRISRYYEQMSMGQFMLLGDYFDQMITVKESEINSTSYSVAANRAVELANEAPEFRTGSGLKIADFDQWTDGAKSGEAKTNAPDDPNSFDHIMVIFRNHHTLGGGSGSVDAGSYPPLFGHKCDTRSRFGGKNGLPHEILRHEFNHLLFGGNNFHVGGGNGHNFYSYFMCLQGGWSMMGGASSSLLTCNAWDRNFLGWKGPGKELTISVLDLDGTEVSADLDPINGDTGIFIIRDFIPSGDALRIKLPYLPDDEFPQWIWIENHQTYANNGCESDRWHFEPADCIKPAVPGLYAYMQVDKDPESANLYGGYADYLRALPANGYYDIRPLEDTVRTACIGVGDFPAYSLLPKNSNPLSGNHEMEAPVLDSDGDGKIGAKEAFMTRVEKVNGTFTDHLNFMGHTRHAFTLNGNNKLGMGTNPSTANKQTLVSAARDKFKGGKPNNRVIYLNGISVEMLETMPDGAYKIRVRNNDTRIMQHLRWCGDSIVLPAIQGYKGHSLYLENGAQILIDRSLTPSRLDEAMEYRDQMLFNDPTRFTVEQNASMYMARGSFLHITNGSEVHVMPGAKLEMEGGSGILIEDGAKLIVHPGAELVQNGKAKIKTKGGYLMCCGEVKE